MDVARTADAHGVAELVGDDLDGGPEASRRQPVGVRPLYREEGGRGEQRGRPGPEVLGGDVDLGDAPQVVVHIVRADGTGVPVVVDVLEQELTGQLLASAHDPREAAIAERDAVLTPALPSEREVHGVAVELGVAAPHRREPVRTVLLGVFLVADADHRELEQADDRGKHLLAREPAAAEVVGHMTAKSSQHVAELDEAVELRPLADLAIARMVPIHLAALAVPPGRLQVPPTVGTDPHVDPRRRDGERLDPRARSPSSAIRSPSAPK